MQCSPVVHAVTTDRLGPLKPTFMHPYPAAMLTRDAGTKKGEMRRAPRAAYSPCVSSIIGIDGTNSSLNSGRLQINLKPFASRDVKADEVIKQLQQATAGVTGIQLYLQPAQDRTVNEQVSPSQYQFTRDDADSENLVKWSPALVAALQQRPEFNGVVSNLQDQGRVSADLPADVTATALCAMVEGFSRYWDGPITDDEFEDCRRGLLSGMNGVEDSLGGMETWYYIEVLRAGAHSAAPIQTPAQARAALQAVTKEDVRSILRQLTLSVSYLLTKEEPTHA